MSYTAVVLTDEDHDKLVAKLGYLWQGESGWTVFAHHMTLHMGPARPEEEPLLGSFVTLTVNATGMDDKVVAARVIPWDVKSDNKIPHITLAVNRDAGGKPFMSNKLEDWQEIESFTVRGKIEVVD